MRRSSKKILHFISSGGFFGAENVVLLLAQYLSRAGYDVILGALEDSREVHTEILERAKELGLKTVVFKSEGKFALKTVFTLKKFLEDNRIDILHTHNYKSDIIGLLAAKMSGVPIVATAHGYTDMTHAVSSYEKLDRWILKNFFSCVAVVTDNILYDMSATKRRVIGNGLDLKKFSAKRDERSDIRRRYGIAQKEIVIATVGRLSQEKNQSLFIEAAGQLVKRYNDLKFLIIGGGPQEENLRAHIESKGLEECVILTGVIKDMPPVYQAMDIFVLSSLTEGIPLTILEAMAAKVPVVATRVGGVPDVIEDRNTGLLVPSGEVSALVEALEVILKDQTLARGLSEAAFKVVESHYSAEKMFENYKRLYDEVPR